ncbi:hypothetical protein EDB92DRAFT_2008494 [Lactarius akahatsu]|uniref:Uncharacterized protein n=1 Tax=Lactarius akahatsu TaxID=416441 RepID=A0AAD4LCJ4_9AGAM|nr:hypothetical protein EDB92DRAFT_2008494 [Lactarius akahatsu]
MSSNSTQISPDTDSPESDYILMPFVSYTQSQILWLYKSPLVSPPNGMPPLKDWFGYASSFMHFFDLRTMLYERGTNGGLNSSVVSTSILLIFHLSFRRDQEDAADLPPRATFRSTLSQPSQMGNFKHQSIRTSERERDKDTDRDRERDLRDKEGQERLRNLSDKYDRDRLSSPAGGTALRTRERDSAPHLAGGTSRLPSQNSLGSGTARRTDGRDSSRRKAGESSEDWRRGREERSDSLRRDREDRERPRSRVRDSSKQRRDSSPSRRDRESERDRDRDRDRDEHRRRDDRRDDHIRRDRDVERDDNDDHRRWRDDGKRDERIAARRELRDKEHREREREREGSVVPVPANVPRIWIRSVRAIENATVGSWTNVSLSEPTDATGVGTVETRIEMAKTATSARIQGDSGAGILGGKAENGELDGIQAWKLGMKEKERKERESEALRSNSDIECPGSAKATEIPATPPAEPPLDEIQLFKLMIKREEEKNHAASLKDPMNDSAVTYIGPGSDSDPSAQKISTSTSDAQPASGFAPSPLVETLAPPTAPSTKPSTPSTESPKLLGSRFFPNPSVSEGPAPQSQPDRQSASTIKSPIPSQFNPPAGSRLLAFGSRTPSAAATTLLSEHPSTFTLSTSTLDTPQSLPPLMNGSRLGPDIDALNTDIAALSISAGLPPGFSNPNRQPVFSSDASAHTQSEMLRRQSLASFGDRTTYATSDLTSYSELGSANPLGLQSNVPNSQSPSFEPNGRERGLGGSPFPQQKGSRFAKFFDGKSRDQPATASTESLDAFSHPLLSYQRQQSIGGGDYPINAENRTMEDIFAMLQNSTQGQRLAQGSPHAQASGYNQAAFPQQHTHIQAARQAQLPPMSRNHDILYDNRLDDRNFVPDGMVPGLRSTFPSRRESGMFQDPLDDLNAFSVQQRIQPQRTVDQMYPAPVPSMFPNQTNMQRNPGLPMQQPFRNGNSPNATHLHVSPQQRLPPGLANLGGRPPHDPSQFLGSIMGVPSPHLQGGSGQPAYNFSGYPAAPQHRGPPAPSPNLPSAMEPGHVGPLLHASKLDVRAATQAQLSGLNNGGLRAPSIGFPQQNALPMHVPHAALRQQSHVHQQPHPQAMSHLLPQHLQAGAGGNSQPAQDLMTLLMHGAPRD